MYTCRVTTVTVSSFLRAPAHQYYIDHTALVPRDRYISFIHDDDKLNVGQARESDPVSHYCHARPYGPGGSPTDQPGDRPDALQPTYAQSTQSARGQEGRAGGGGWMQW